MEDQFELNCFLLEGMVFGSFECFSPAPGSEVAYCCRLLTQIFKIITCFIISVTDANIFVNLVQLHTPAVL